MTNQDRVNQYKAGLITWDEMQSLLIKAGYKMTRVSAVGDYRLLPTK